MSVDYLKVGKKITTENTGRVDTIHVFNRWSEVRDEAELRTLSTTPSPTLTERQAAWYNYPGLMRVGVYISNNWNAGGHCGIDYAAVNSNYRGIDLFPVYEGKVYGTSTSGGNGNCVVVYHELERDGTKYVFYSHYAHLKSISVSENDTVTIETPIGKLGNTGYIVTSGDGEGYHLHLGIWIEVSPNTTVSKMPWGYYGDTTVGGYTTSYADNSSTNGFMYVPDTYERAKLNHDNACYSRWFRFYNYARVYADAGDFIIDNYHGVSSNVMGKPNAEG